MKRILVIDDNEDIRFALATILEDAGYEVVEAAAGSEAVALAGNHHPDVVLLDLQLPPPDGLEILSQIKAIPAFNRAPVIIVTGSASDRDLRMAKTLGAWDYITKPWAMGEIEARVSLALQAAPDPQPPLVPLPIVFSETALPIGLQPQAR